MNKGRPIKNLTTDGKRICCICRKPKELKEYYTNYITCKICHRKIVKKHREQNKKHYEKYRIKYEADNYEKILERKREWERKNKERIKEQRKQYQLKNIKKIKKWRKEYLKKYREKNRERINERQRANYQNKKKQSI